MIKYSRTVWNNFNFLPMAFIAGLFTLITFPVFAEPIVYVGEASNNNIRAIDTATNTEMAAITTNSYSRVAVHPTGDYFYQTVNPGAWSFASLNVYETNNNSMIASIPVGVQPIELAVHPSGDFVYVVSKSADLPNVPGLGMLYVIDTSTNTVTTTIELNIDLMLTAAFITVHPSGDLLYIGIKSSGTITKFDTSTLQTVESFNIAPGFHDMAIHPTGRYIYAAGATLQVVDTESNNVVDSIVTNGIGYSVDVAPDGNTIYVANYTSSTISVVDANTKVMTATVATSYPLGLVVHPSGDFVYATGFGFGATGTEGFVSVIDTANNQITDSIITGGLPLTIAIGPLPDPVGGTTTGLATTTATCSNLTSGQSILIQLGGAKAWDCESSGLQVNSGDSIKMVVTGSAK